MDKDKNGIVDEYEEISEVGMIFEESPNYPELSLGYVEPAADRDVFIEDQWNVGISGYAPIRDQDGHSIAILGVDVKSYTLANSFTKINRAYIGSLVLSMLFSGALVVLIMIWIVGSWERKHFYSSV